MCSGVYQGRQTLLLDGVPSTVEGAPQRLQRLPHEWSYPIEVGNCVQILPTGSPEPHREDAIRPLSGHMGHNKVPLAGNFLTGVPRALIRNLYLSFLLSPGGPA